MFVLQILYRDKFSVKKMLVKVLRDLDIENKTYNNYG